MLKHISILLPSLVSLFWLVLFLLNRKRNSYTQNIWTVVLGCITLSMGIMAFFWYSNGNYSLFYKLDILDNFVTLSFFPVIFLYFKKVTGDQSKWVNLKNGLLFLPPVLLGGVALVVYLLMGEEQAAAYSRAVVENREGLWQNSSVYSRILFITGEYLYSIFILIQGIWVFIYAFHRLFLFRRRLNDFFSDTDDKDIEHHQAALWGILILILLTFIVALSGYLQYIEYDIWVSVITVTTGIFLFYVCYHVSLSHYTAESFDRELILSDQKAIREGYAPPGKEEKDPDEETENKKHSHQKYIRKFNAVIDQDQVFLQKKLRLDDIALLVGTNRTYISRILKDEYNCSFWEFINRRRIEYAKEQARRYPNLTVDELSSTCGFSQTPAFCRAFRQYEGITFKEWQKIPVV